MKQLLNELELLSFIILFYIGSSDASSEACETYASFQYFARE